MKIPTDVLHAGRHDPDHRERLAGQLDALPYNVGIGIEARVELLDLRAQIAHFVHGSMQLGVGIAHLHQ